MIELSYYLFEHSYLMGVEYNPIVGSMKLKIDAKLTFAHPSVSNTDDEAKFVEIELEFEGVRYLKILSSSLLTNNPNEDLGSIENLEVIKNFDNNRNISVKRTKDKFELATELSNEETVSIFTKSCEFTLITFNSEMISFELGCEKVIVNEICEK